MQWKQIRYKLEWIGVNALATVIPRLPRRWVALLAKAVGSVGFIVDQKGRAVTIANIEAALGDEYTPQQRIRIGRKSYQYFARTMLDLFWAPRLAQPGWEQYVEIIGEEHFAASMGTPTVTLCAHHAGVEWGSIACGRRGYLGCVLTQAFKNPQLNKLFSDLRGCTGQEIITQDMSMLRMLRRVAKGGLVGLLIDLNLPPSQAATVIDTFGMKMCCTYTHAILAQRTGANLIPMLCEPLPDGRCRINLYPPLKIPEGATGQQIAQLSWDFLEDKIREKPELWMWIYKHWRFKPKGDTHAYPFYANESGKFQKLVRDIPTESGR